MANLSELNRCRLCFTQKNLTDAIFPAGGDPNNELMSQIYACTTVRICFEKDFPCPVCSSCIRIVNQFYAFRGKCRDNDRQLREERGEKDFDEEEEEGDDDPLYAGGRKIKQEVRDDGFYGQMKEQINSYLQQQVRIIEQKALAKVSAALKGRSGESCEEDQMGLQMTVDTVLGGQQSGQQDTIESLEMDDFGGFDEDRNSEEDDSANYGHSSTADQTDWKNKYLTLRKNNALLQRAFREHKSKMRTTEQRLKFYKQQGRPTEEVPGLGFKVNSAFPEITVDDLEQLNYRSGPGEKGDRNFVNKLATAVFGLDTLMNSSVTGRVSNAHRNLPPRPGLCSKKLAGICLKLFERVQLEVGISEQEEVLIRANDRVVKQVICQKVANLRKKIDKNGGGDGGGEGADDEEYTPQPRKRAKQ